MTKVKEAFDILREQWKKIEDIESRIKVYEKRIEKLEAQKKKVSANHKGWIDLLLPPLAEELKTELGKAHYELLGPFGLTAETSIWFYDTKEERDSYVFPSLSIRPDLFNDDNSFGISIKGAEGNDEYPKNSIGAVNGMNYSSIIPPKDADVKWFLQYVNL